MSGELQRAIICGDWKAAEWLLEQPRYPRPIKRAMPTYADGYHGLERRRHRGILHRLMIRLAR